MQRNEASFRCDYTQSSFQRNTIAMDIWSIEGVLGTVPSKAYEDYKIQRLSSTLRFNAALGLPFSDEISECALVRWLYNESHCLISQLMIHLGTIPCQMPLGDDDSYLKWRRVYPNFNLTNFIAFINTQSSHLE